MGILDALMGNRNFVPRGSLPTEGWCDVPGIGRLSLVWPWHAVPDPEPLVDQHGRPIFTPAVEIRAPRTDTEVALAIWTESGGGFAVTRSWSLSTARSYGGQVERDTAMVLGGLTGRIVTVSVGGEVVWRLLVPRSEDSVHGELRVPAVSADGYWPQVETMLSTWSWSS